jgi:hypothetical protein
MKTITIILLLAVFALPAYSQNITNTLGTSGVFTIKDNTTTFLTLSQSNGLLSLNKNLSLLNTTDSTLGVITKGGYRFIHDFAPAGAYGNNTFVGINSGNFTMSGDGTYSSCNTGVGNSSLQGLTTGRGNTAMGFESLYANTTGSENLAIGLQSLFSNTTGTGNTAVGSIALISNTTGNLNTAVGLSSLYSNTTGYQNTAVGLQSLYANTTGINNTAVGLVALVTNTTGGNNTAMGFSSLYANTTGDANTAVGASSLYTNTGIANTALGVSSLYNNTTGNWNTAVGVNAGNTITTGSNNTLIGSNAEPSAADISNEITLGNSSVTALRCQVTSITALSDARDKKNINDLSLGIDFLMKIKPRLFNWDKREWYKDNKSDGSKMQKTPTAGFIAQELDEVQTKEKAEWLNLVLKNNPDKLEATPGNLLPVMVKAIQELKNKNDELKERSEKLEAKNEKLDAKNQNLEEKLLKFEQIQTKFEQIQNDLVNKIEKLQSSKEK